jgi:hypothetical protein
MLKSGVKFRWIIAGLALIILSVMIIYSSSIKQNILLGSNVELSSAYNLEVSNKWYFPEELSSEELPIGFYDMSNTYRNDANCFISLEQAETSELRKFHRWTADIQASTTMAFPKGVPVLGSLNENSFHKIYFYDLDANVEMVKARPIYVIAYNYTTDSHNVVSLYRTSVLSDIAVKINFGCPKGSEIKPESLFNEVKLKPVEIK